jgi:hypothetical protein
MLKEFVVGAALMLSANQLNAAQMGFVNNLGGKTIITDQSTFCASMKAYDGYAWNADKTKYTRFCWVNGGNGHINVVFPSGESGMYPAAAFEKIDQEEDVSFITQDVKE